MLLSFVDGTDPDIPLSDHLPVTAGFSYSIVPEPGSAALALLGLTGLAACGRRQA